MTPSVLAVTSEPPWPLDSGGRLRTFHLLRAVAGAFPTRVVCPVSPGQQPAVTELAGRGLDIEPAAVGPRSPVAEARRLLSARLRGEPYVLYRRHARPEVVATWRSTLHDRRPAVAYLDHLDSWLYAPLAQRAGLPVVLDLHNVYSTLVRRTAAEQPNPLKRWFLRGEANRLARVERRAVAGADLVFAVSDADADHFRAIGGRNVHVVPNGVDCAAVSTLPTGRPPGPPVVLYLGTMSWGPNAAAAVFLTNEVLPKVRARHPDAILLVVGKDPGPDVLALRDRPGVEVTGGVPDVVPYLRRATALAVPLDSGGGTRLKILEAFAAGLPVVSTAVGAEGIACAPGEHYRLAERPGFADGVLGVIADPMAAAAMAGRARLLVRETYDWSAIGVRAVELIRGVVRPGG